MGDYVHASKKLTASGQVQNQAGNNLGRAAVSGIVLTGTAAGSSLVLRDGGSTGAVVLEVDLGAETKTVDVPGDGVLCANGIYATLTTIGSVTIFYRG
jgi:hypothetical protein